MAKVTGPAQVRLVCGLGNPGNEYVHTRHNAGFACIDALAERAQVHYWKTDAGCLVASARIGSHEVLLSKPQGYMNTSGGPLSKLMRAHGISPAEILVIHDEVDLPAGEVRTKFGGGLNAHNGLRSIVLATFLVCSVVSVDRRERCRLPIGLSVSSKAHFWMILS